MHLIRSTSFEAAKIVNAAKYAGLKAEDFQSVKALRTAKDIQFLNLKFDRNSIGQSILRTNVLDQ